MEASDESSKQLLIQMCRICSANPKMYPFTLVIVERVSASSNPHSEWIEKCIDIVGKNSLSFSLKPFSCHSIEEVKKNHKK